MLAAGGSDTFDHQGEHAHVSSALILLFAGGQISSRKSFLTTKSASLWLAHIL
jgi:hypothetical protein